MTTGSYDRRRVVGYTPVTGFPLNLIERNSWSGGDSPPTYTRPSKAYKHFVIPARYSLRKGKWVQVVPQIVGRRRVFVDLPPKRARQRSPHNFSRGIETIHEGCGVMGASYEVSFYNTVSHDSHWTSNDDIVLVNKLRAKMLGSDFHLGVFLGELGRSADLIHDSVRRIAHAYRATRRGSPLEAWHALTQGIGHRGPSGRKPPTFSNDVSSNWLKLYYGVKPLLSDVQDAAQMLGWQTSAPMLQRFVVDRYVRGSRIDFHRELVSLGSAGPWTFDGYLETRESKRLIALVERVPVVPLVGLTDVASIAWELTPYSFVADWFIPIGSYLSALSTDRALGSATYIYSHRWQTRLRGVSINPRTDAWRIRPADYEVNRFSLIRSVTDTLSLPPPAPKPLVKVPSVARAITSIALLVQKFGSGGR